MSKDFVLDQETCQEIVDRILFLAYGTNLKQIFIETDNKIEIQKMC